MLPEGRPPRQLLVIHLKPRRQAFLSQAHADVRLRALRPSNMARALRMHAWPCDCDSAGMDDRAQSRRATNTPAAQTAARPSLSSNREAGQFRPP